jgi:ribonucleotide reductase alpha subunit
MTETAPDTTSGRKRAASAAGKGLTVERVYTTPGVHPYDEVTWERRDVVQTNWRTGETIFEQRGVEFPDFWSVNASTIVTTKYFRGALGTEEREHSLRQLLDRVVLTYVRSGRDHGYFASDADAEVFEHELTWMLLHQVFSFNSPVWFNVGTSSPQQVSACQPHDSLVSTPDGLVPIGELVERNAVGAKVYDAHGLTTILAVKHNGTKDVLGIRTESGAVLDVTGDHLVWRADDEGLFDGAFVDADCLAVGEHLLNVDPDMGGRNARRDEVVRIEYLGPMPVYDIQTESGEYLSGNLRVHNCFILAVEDSMDSILNWYREEGMIFKGGSGAGLNLSRIRSSKELLRSSGGTASGPVSFMRGADASAGTIKSGGATRRAAKMVVLDVDHPDVEEFVETKAREEDKIRVLRDAGFDMDLGGHDITSVQYQNANNSVRVTDAYMRAVEEGGRFGLTARTTGEVIDEVDARELWGKIAKAAWECADPGVQYDDTINDWHTTPESGRITASNPCFTGDTLVALGDGTTERFDNLVGRDVAVFAKDSQGKTVVRMMRRVRLTRHDAQIVRVTLDDGSSVRCTPDHRFMLRTGEFRAARELTAGEGLMRWDADILADAHNHRVVAVEPAGYADVYDGTVDELHNFAISTTDGSGVFVHNCSEYMHLDNSSCNLASLNLLKFLEDDGSFDAETFAKAVEIVITAMDISICFADFPTEAIGETTRKFRQLGIGYANLGALLMASGLAYDSDGGRALAAAITSLMTGTSYKRSAELAGVVGPYEGFARNAEAHARVMRKHAAANDAIRTMHALDRNVHHLATQMWEEGNAIGARNGWRNAQASVLAPTGCLAGDTLVTTDRGLQRLSELGDVWGHRWQDLDVRVATDDGVRQATRFFVNGEEPTRRIVTEGGYRIQGTLAHRIRIVDSDGQWSWRRLSDVKPGDVAPLQLAGSLVGDPRVVPLPVLDQAYDAGDRNIVVPQHVDADLAELVGYFMGDGSLHATGIRFCVADTDLDVVERLRILGKGLFNLEPVVTQQQGYQEVVLQSVRLARWWQAAGFAKELPGVDHAGKGWTPRIPAAVRETNDAEVYAAFLRGVFEADGTVLERVPSVSTASEQFAEDIRTMLLWLGIPTTTRNTTSGRGGASYQIRVRNLQWATGFGERIGFMGSRKSALVATELSQQSGNRDRIHLPEQVWLETAPVGHDLRRLVVQALARGVGVSRDLASRLFWTNPDERLGKALGYLFETVASNEDGGLQPTYDISVPSNVTYVANGFVSHNTIGFMMDCDTTGIEPDFSLVKFKKLVGGGSMQIVNQTIPRALHRLGYAGETIEAIVEYIAEHGHVVGAPGLKPEHYEVFDCAIGERSIKPMGHVRMMAACQPFLSGAISKCVVGDTLLTTGEGLIRIQSLHRGEEADTFRDEILEVDSPGGPQKTDAFYYGGVRPVRHVVLRSGHRLTGTPNHRVLTATREGLQWCYLSELRPGDFVAQHYGSEMWSSVPGRFEFTPSPSHGSQKTIHVPEEMTEELAFLLGAYASEGHTTESNYTVVITNSVDQVLERVRQAWRNVFDLEARIERRDDRCPQVMVSSKTLVEFLRYLGAGTRAREKRIPDAVLRSPRAMVLAFLQGLALDAFCSSSQQQAKWAICLDSPRLLDDLQAVLTNLGVVHGRISKRNKQNGKTYDEVYASGEWAREMTLLVPFLEPDKVAMAERLLTKSFGRGTSDVVPFLTGRQLYDAIPKSKCGRNGESRRRGFTYLLDPRTKNPTMETLAKVAAIPGVELPQAAYDVLWDRIHFSPVESVSDAGEREVYDISVPTTHAFVGNGIVNHNTVNLPESATIDDIADVYFQGWKLGLKALAVYRDDCKVGQPLGDGKKKKDAPAEAPDVQTVVEYRPTRKRLPKSRPSRTTSFSVGGAEGYMTAGSYPDDGLGEVFLKLGKQGSTLAGVMDAFSIAISIALQYGVPLETYVEKFTNMRFEPAGLTDDPDVRMSQSVMDYVFRRLALDYLPFETRAGLGIYTAEERARQLETGSYTPTDTESEEDYEGFSQSAPVARAARPAAPAEVADSGAGAATAKAAPVEVHSSAELLEALQGKASDAPMCFTCGTKMRPAGSCYVCEGCGSTSGCS